MSNENSAIAASVGSIAQVDGSVKRNDQPMSMRCMRASVLDWMNEVCSTYTMHRVTYYMALDYFDRYLATNGINTNRNCIQLIGVTCVLIAAKVEEVHPPLITDLAVLTDNAFSAEDIRLQEVLVLLALDWEMCRLTIIDWLDIYMCGDGSVFRARSEPFPQLDVHSDNVHERAELSLSPKTYAQAAQLIDLCALDIEMTNYSYPVIAAAAISHIIDRETAIQSSGLDWESIGACARWMDAYFCICTATSKRQRERIGPKNFNMHPNHDSYHIQLRTTNMEMFVRMTMPLNSLFAEKNVP